jgi:anti-anti-sigma factor
MTISEHADKDRIVLDVDGRIDANTSEQLQNAILAALRDAKHITVNFAKVPYLSSAGLRALLLGHKQASSKGATMEISNPSEFVTGVLSAVGFDKVLNITHSK